MERYVTQIWVIPVFYTSPGHAPAGRTTPRSNMAMGMSRMSHGSRWKLRCS